MKNVEGRQKWEKIKQGNKKYEEEKQRKKISGKADRHVRKILVWNPQTITKGVLGGSWAKEREAEKK